MTAAQWLPVLGTVLVAFIAAFSVTLSELIKRTKTKSATRLETAQADEVTARVYADLMETLQRDRKELRHIIAGLEQKIVALEKRVDDVTASARGERDRAEIAEGRSDRNIRKLQAHIGKLSVIMREAGLEVPDPPTLEQEELGQAIPKLMAEPAANYDPAFNFKGKGPGL